VDCALADLDLEQLHPIDVAREAALRWHGATRSAMSWRRSTGTNSGQPWGNCQVGHRMPMSVRSLMRSAASLPFLKSVL
jgi:hypothetical protein